MATYKLAEKIITTALTGDDIYVSPVVFMQQPVLSVCVHFQFVYGADGTNADAYLQTSIDGGASWIDVANFRVTTGSADKVINLSALTSQTTQITPSDGSMSANTAQDGVCGRHWRVKMKSSGTYSGSSTMKVWASFKNAAIA